MLLPADTVSLCLTSAGVNMNMNMPRQPSYTNNMKSNMNQSEIMKLHDDLINFPIFLFLFSFTPSVSIDFSPKLNRIGTQLPVTYN